MVTTSPLVTDWVNNKLNWRYYIEPRAGPITIGPSSSVAVPASGYFKAPEGVLLGFWAVFDSPYGGLRMLADPDMDWAWAYTINNLVADGLTRPGNIIYASIPPITPAGSYGIFFEADYPWINYCDLYLINTDPNNSITCISYGYVMAVLTEPRVTCCEKLLEAILQIKEGLKTSEIIPTPPEVPPEEVVEEDPIDVALLGMEEEEE